MEPVLGDRRVIGRSGNECTETKDAIQSYPLLMRVP